MNSRSVDIILVEDSQFDIDMMLRVLAEQAPEYKVVCFKDGDDFINSIKDKSIHFVNSPLIFMDINMPLKNGDECLRDLNSMGLGFIPVIMLTTSCDNEEFLRLYKLGANACTTKPGSFSEYRELVGSTLHFWSKTTILPNVSLN